MSLPLVFPPIEVDGQILVDGGAMNNVPADVVKAMGADRVVAINVPLGEYGSLDWRRAADLMQEGYRADGRWRTYFGIGRVFR